MEKPSWRSQRIEIARICLMEDLGLEVALLTKYVNFLIGKAFVVFVERSREG
jgi:hypothetical protein